MLRGAAGRPSARQLAIVRLAAGGCTDQEIAQRLGISYHTVRTHFQRLAVRHGVRGRVAVAVAVLAVFAEGGSASDPTFVGWLVSLFD